MKSPFQSFKIIPILGMLFLKFKKWDNVQFVKQEYYYVATWNNMY